LAPARKARAACLAAGATIKLRGPIAVMGFTVRAGKIVEVDAISDPERIRKISAGVLIDDGRTPGTSG
jgi:hypothetical protein